MTSNHLDISSVWKSLVASSLLCVCCVVCVGWGGGGAEVRTRVFNVFVSSAKRVCLQRQRCAFIASDRRVCLQYSSYSGGSSRGYLVAGDKHVRLPYDLVFGSQ